MASTLLDAFEKIRSDKHLAEQFTTDPEAVLEKLNVATDNLVIQRGPKGRLSPTILQGPEARLTVCGSLGYIACVTVGGEVVL